jgi:CheY-like chemotaxis protein
MSIDGVGRKSGTVLIIDSDEAIRGLIRSILGQQGFEVIEGAGAHALAMCRALGEPVDVVLCEDGLPGESAIPVVPLPKPFIIGELVGYLHSAVSRTKTTEPQA